MVGKRIRVTEQHGVQMPAPDQAKTSQEEVSEGVHPDLFGKLVKIGQNHQIEVRLLLVAFRRDKHLNKVGLAELDGVDFYALPEQKWRDAHFEGPTYQVDMPKLAHRYLIMVPVKSNGGLINMPKLMLVSDHPSSVKWSGGGTDGRFQAGHYDETRFKD